MFNPELNEMYARERQYDYLREAADDARVRQASAPRPRLGVHLVARLGQWFQRPRRRPALQLGIRPAPQHR